jgi:hypothetical protein
MDQQCCNDATEWNPLLGAIEPVVSSTSRSYNNLQRVRKNDSPQEKRSYQPIVAVSSISQQIAEIQSPLPRYFVVPNSDDSQVPWN